MAIANLTAIQQKVRRLTRSPSTSQLSDADLNDYINTFILYDFPEHIRTFNYHTTFTFYTNTGQDLYPTDTLSFAGATNNILYDFQNKYLTVNGPVYIAGYQSFFTQSREQFFAIYPKTNSIAQTGFRGNGALTSFTGVVNTQMSVVPPGLIQQICLLQNQVLFSSVATNGQALSMIDIPLTNTTTGNKATIGNLYNPNSAAYQAALATPPTVVDPTNTINYLTGVYTVTFSAAPASGININSQTVLQQLGLPQALLFYDNHFIVRPVPDQSYRVQFETYIRPTALPTLTPDSTYPALQEYWEYIAYGAAKKIFQDRMDMDSVALIEPQFKEWERLVLRRTIVQITNERTSTIYTEQTSFGAGNGFGWGGTGPF